MYDKTISLLKMTGYFKQRNLVYDYVDQASKILKEQTGRELGDYPKKD